MNPNALIVRDSVHASVSPPRQIVDARHGQLSHHAVVKQASNLLEQ